LPGLAPGFAFPGQIIFQNSASIGLLKAVDKPVHKLSSNCGQVVSFQKTKNYPEFIHRQASGLPSGNKYIQVYENKQKFVFIHRLVAKLFSVVGLHIVIIKNPVHRANLKS
jgi:hypothetical protein